MAPPPPVTGRLSTAGRRHWSRRSSSELAQPASRGGLVTFMVLLLIVAVAVALALAVPGAHLGRFLGL